MRLTSDFFVSHLVRRVFADGGFAAVARRGSEAAGAIFVISRPRTGAIALYSPASQTHSSADGDRRFMKESAGDDAELAARFAREARFDPDFWIVEIETAEPERYIDVAEE